MNEAKELLSKLLIAFQNKTLWQDHEYCSELVEECRRFLLRLRPEPDLRPKPESKQEGIIRTKIFFDDNGERTCALDFEKGAVCEFYRTQHFGTHETCLFAPSCGNRGEGLERKGFDGLGLLIPGKWCPIKTE